MRYVRAWIALTISAIIGWLLGLCSALYYWKSDEIDHHIAWVSSLSYNREGNEISQQPFSSSFNASLSWDDCAFFECVRHAECTEISRLRELLYTAPLASLVQAIGEHGNGLRCCHSLLFVMLRAWKEVAEDLRIGYLVSYGTLLGGVREGGLIQWTADVDIALNYSALDYLLDLKVRGMLWSQGWLLFHQACGRMCFARGSELAGSLVPDYDTLRPSHRWLTEKDQRMSQVASPLCGLLWLL